MGISSRIQRLVKASVHEGLDRMEDPLALVKQDIRDTKESIKKKKNQISKQERMHSVFERSIDMAGKLAEKRQEQAAAALDKEEEDFARRALLEKKQALKEQERYTALIEQNQDFILELKEEIGQLEHSLLHKAEEQRELEQQKEAARAGAELEKLYAKTSHVSHVKESDPIIMDKWKQAAAEIENDDLKAEIEEELEQLKASRKS
ncbi:PspA/IM30 family protein [Alkalicoccobacillus porphyridii]|nr:PspA/IM30 family protein [Alkalicoccobacillus porphyridii]